MLSLENLIKKFDLKAHPEGGYFKEYYRSSETISQQALPVRFKGDRCFSTSIYFLLPYGSISRLHRIAADEIWHFYLGGPLELLQLFPEGKIEKIVLGQDVEAGQMLQHVVPAGCWFGATPVEGSTYSFVGCTVAPGFDFDDFEMADVDALGRQFPHLTADLLFFK
jgi:predicted cupin superfamily sugar epimerase